MSLGDFGRLLRKTSEPEPTSLMNGAYFHESLRGILESCSSGRSRRRMPTVSPTM